MKKTTSLALSIFALVMLQACGGGSGGGSDGGAGASAGAGSDHSAAPSGTGQDRANTGSASAPFNRGASARYQLVGANLQLSSRLTNGVQETDGAMTTLDSNVLSGSKAVKDISGDTSYAMGRWVAGTATIFTDVKTLTGIDSRSYHYIVFNTLSALPASGTMTCDAGAFTAATPTNGSSDGAGSATGNATLSFAAEGASVGGTINVAASGSSGKVDFSGTIKTPTSSVSSGVYGGGGTGASIQIGDGGSGAYLVITNYAATLANGSRYLGIAKFRCS